MTPRFEHAPKGDPCTLCGGPPAFHRLRAPRPSRPGREDYHAEDRKRPSRIDRIIGIDGEGQGRKPHRYFYLAAVAEDGETWERRPITPSLGRLTTEQCLSLICGLPDRSLIVSFAFRYDLTKILHDVPAEKLYSLVHEESRVYTDPETGDERLRPVYWGDWKLNFLAGRFSVGRRDAGTRTVWDLFKFYQCSFVEALRLWKIAPDSALETMAAMKAQRADFDKLDHSAIETYCKDECKYLAALGRGLIDAHEAAGLRLKNYFGPGSTASAMLGKMGIRDEIQPHPESMREAVASAYFGGRMETGRLGELSGSLVGYDIASAYPAAMFDLPCLRCGRWRRVHRGLDKSLHNAATAVIRWHLPMVKRCGSRPWGPLPVRAPDGSTTYPLAARGGWAWRPEFRAAQSLAPHLEAKEAWVLSKECDHKPFASMPDYYRERASLGKDAKGIVLKLAMNSCYGKLAQSRGRKPPFQCWTWTGLITATTRARLLEAIAVAPERVVMVATDGVISRGPLALPQHPDNGTNDMAKPLGSWETKTHDRPIFLYGVGQYFPLPPDGYQAVRSRGVPRRSVHHAWERIVDGWTRGDTTVTIPGPDQFIGLKSGTRSGKAHKDLGDWLKGDRSITFSAQPKRASLIRRTGELVPWLEKKAASEPYGPAMGKDAGDAMLTMALRAAKDLEMDQP